MSRLAPSPVDVSPRPFRFGIPDLKAFPYKLWLRLVIRQARQMPSGMFTYQNLAGYQPLREAIAAHVNVTRGVHCIADQILILSGAQGGLDLAARMLLNAGDTVWMEDPGYLKARGAFWVWAQLSSRSRLTMKGWSLRPAFLARRRLGWPM
jgi:DNA-binding transcriptional MocR family regulator